jgi:putative addiction module killer protein
VSSEITTVLTVFDENFETGMKTRLTRLSPIDYSRPVIEREIKKLELQSGLVPFDEWFDSLRDRKMQAAVDARLARVRAGNFGDCKSVGGGVFELRIALGPGLRVYYGLRGQQIVILLGGGDKSTQTRDLRRAQQLWQQFTKHASEKL